MLQVLHPTYDFRVTVQGDALKGGVWNSLDAKSGCDEMWGRVRKALGDERRIGAAVRYEPASGGYNVLDGERFVGRVVRSRSTYCHSNGRTYRYWSWSAFPLLGRGTFEHRTRKSAIKALIKANES